MKTSVNSSTWSAIVLILLCFSSGSGAARAATPGAVLAWGAGAGMDPDEFYDSKGQSVVPAIARGEVTAAAGGSVHTLALKTDGGVVAWGWNQYDQTDVPLAARRGVVAIAGGVVGISAGFDFSLALVGDAPALVVQASGDKVSLSWPVWPEHSRSKPPRLYQIKTPGPQSEPCLRSKVRTTGSQTQSRARRDSTS